MTIKNPDAPNRPISADHPPRSSGSESDPEARDDENATVDLETVDPGEAQPPDFAERKQFRIAYGLDDDFPEAYARWRSLTVGAPEAVMSQAHDPDHGRGKPSVIAGVLNQLSQEEELLRVKLKADMTPENLTRLLDIRECIALLKLNISPAADDALDKESDAMIAVFDAVSAAKDALAAVMRRHAGVVLRWRLNRAFPQGVHVSVEPGHLDRSGLDALVGLQIVEDLLEPLRPTIRKRRKGHPTTRARDLLIFAMAFASVHMQKRLSMEKVVEILLDVGYASIKSATVTTAVTSENKTRAREGRRLVPTIRTLASWNSLLEQRGAKKWLS